MQFQVSHATLQRVIEDSKSRLRNSPIGSLVPISVTNARYGEDYETDAYVPEGLPEQVDLPGPVWMAVSEAMSELGRLDAAAALIPDPQPILRIADPTEAVGTSALEGTYADLTQIFAAEALPVMSSRPTCPRMSAR